MTPASLWYYRLWVMTRKELLQLGRDKVILAVLVWFFLGEVYMAASGISMQLRHASFVVMDNSNTPASRELISRFQEPYFTFKGRVTSPEQGLALLDQGKVMAMLDIPADLESRLLRGEVSNVQLQMDTTNTILGTLASSYAAQIVASFAQEQALQLQQLPPRQMEAMPSIENRTRVWYNPNQRDPWFMGISEMMTVITMLSLMLPAAAMVREKERGTIEQLAVSPLTPFQILLPKILAMGLALLIGVTACITFILIWQFDLPFVGSPLLFLLLTALFIFATSGMSLFIATIARNLGQVVMLVILILMPILLLSGAWTPPEAMPDWLRHLMWLSPLYYYIEMGYGVLLKGADLIDLLPNIIGLTLLGTVIFLFGIWRFFRQFE
ncbi:ABC transporter permease [Spartinivicinus ruber]|uniref:ABC transporter permease n=1 Tax=Spartinivicinus ruber TaxID=2683272 RepID=UPI0013D58C45|nr:ABC transporter permease [Spartinivicinus ruber]